ncbi:hypothetical protein G3I43_33220 [Streptomyces anulatus]|uniref:Uncharacterized protein n=1 Tax=Streptomyces anulatus TaxID=1892 RepID=A0A6G3T1H4_STRAQ|nr:hypothetical protein [Streptomyces anulatus]NEB88990.1 hypothetical protein [Streptomyces anulatus]
MGPLGYSGAVPDRPVFSVITSFAGHQLYLTPRPGHGDHFVVAPLLPAGTERAHTDGVPAPRGISVPADPVKAAALIRRRLLLNFRLAAMKAQSNTSSGPEIPVTITLDPNGRPDVLVANARGLYELLGREGLLLDPATGRCRLPESVREPSEVGWRTNRAVRKLVHLGFSVTTRLADGRTFRYSVQGHTATATAEGPVTGYPHTPRRSR